MDQPSLSLAATRVALRDLERVNHWLLGLGASRRTMLPRLCRGPEVQTLVDLGTGSGQIPASLIQAARRRGVDLRVIGVDRKLSHLLCGRERFFEQLRVVADAQALPFADGAADWCFSNLFFHHFDIDANFRILVQMRRVTRCGAVVVDLRRSRLARVLVRLLLPFLMVGAVARYDGVVSADQAWAIDEVARLAQKFRIRELRRRFPFRFSLVLAAAPSEPSER